MRNSFFYPIGRKIIFVHLHQAEHVGIGGGTVSLIEDLLDAIAFARLVILILDVGFDQSFESAPVAAVVRDNIAEAGDQFGVVHLAFDDRTRLGHDVLEELSGDRHPSPPILQLSFGPDASTSNGSDAEEKAEEEGEDGHAALPLTVW